MKVRIYIIDDEPDMAKIGTDLLVGAGYTVNSFTQPVQGLKELRSNPPDLLLLDLRMPEKDGFEVLREMKADVKTKSIPVIMVSVQADEADVVVGLEMGADDYIAKPFRKRELLARVKTVLRRQNSLPDDKKVSYGPIHVDYGRYVATINKKPVDLTPKEFELLGLFLQREGRVLSRAVISEAVWGSQFTGTTRTIDVHVDTLRKKLGKYGDWIHSLKGVGYRFDPDL
jgi:two-component system alkaline phosphatase synthesis response regulator PhoP